MSISELYILGFDSVTVNAYSPLVLIENICPACVDSGELWWRRRTSGYIGGAGHGNWEFGDTTSDQSQRSANRSNVNYALCIPCFFWFCSLEAEEGCGLEGLSSCITNWFWLSVLLVQVSVV